MQTSAPQHAPVISKAHHGRMEKGNMPARHIPFPYAKFRLFTPSPVSGGATPSGNPRTWPPTGCGNAHPAYAANGA